MKVARSIAMSLLLSATALGQSPLGTAFTYQGQLKQAGVPANGEYDFIFRLFDAPVGGAQIGGDVEIDDWLVSHGLFTVELDFGTSAFAGDARWLQVSVRPGYGGGEYADLTPRQPLSATPYALYALSGPGGGNYWAANGTNIYATNAGNVGVGTTAPLDKLHVAGSAANLRLQDDDDPNSYLVFKDMGPTQAWIGKYTATGETLLDLAPIPMDGVSDATMRFFRLTNTTGLKQVRFHSGNGTTATSAVIGVDGTDSVFQLDGGNFGIRTDSPSATLDIGGRVTLSGTPGSVGIVCTRGVEGSYNVLLSYLGGYPDNGFVAVADAASQQQAGMYVAPDGRGVVYADVKNFRLPNRRQAETEIVYACIEGPEAAAYVRGTAQLVAGRAVVDLPEHFQDVAVAAGMTVQVTACSADSKGLAVVERDVDHFVVSELLGGSGSYQFDWEVKAVRKGHEDYRVIRSSSEGRPAVEAVSSRAEGH